MTLDGLIMLSGVLVTLIPFLGFPLKWDNILLTALGILIIMLGIIVRRRGVMRRSAVQRGNGTYVESSPRTDMEAHESR